MPAASCPRVLQDRQSVIESLIDRAGTDDADNSAHAQPPLAVRPCIGPLGPERRTTGARRRNPAKRPRRDVGRPACRTRSSPITARRPFATDSPIRHQHRLPPPVLAIQTQQTGPESRRLEHHEAAEGTEQEARNRSIPLNIDSRTKCATATPIPRTHEQHEHHDDDACRPSRHGRPRKAARPDAAQSDRKKCQPRKSAIIHVTSAMASRRNPRTDPTNAETTMAAITR